MYVFIQLMIKFRHLKRQTARIIWNKFENWLKKRVEGVPAAGERERKSELSLFIPNNCVAAPIKRVLEEFFEGLDDNEKSEVQKLSVKERSGRSLGLSLFVV